MTDTLFILFNFFTKILNKTQTAKRAQFTRRTNSKSIKKGKGRPDRMLSAFQIAEQIGGRMKNRDIFCFFNGDQEFLVSSEKQHALFISRSELTHLRLN